MASRGELPSRGKGKALKLRESALEHFGHTVGVAPGDLSFRLVPDAEAAKVEVERNALKYLRRVVSWRGSEAKTKRRTTTTGPICRASSAKG
jgi:hypothetical protein